LKTVDSIYFSDLRLGFSMILKTVTWYDMVSLVGMFCLSVFLGVVSRHKVELYIDDSFQRLEEDKFWSVVRSDMRQNIILGEDIDYK